VGSRQDVGRNKLRAVPAMDTALPELALLVPAYN